jgi:hypothetical protein
MCVTGQISVQLNKNEWLFFSSELGFVISVLHTHARTKKKAEKEDPEIL